MKVTPNLISPVRDNGTAPYENDLGAPLPDIYADMTRMTPPDPMGFASASDSKSASRSGGIRGKK